MESYRLISFDFDGTLADSAASFTRMYNQLAPEFGLNVIRDEELPELRGYDSRRLMARMGLPMWRLPQFMMRMRAMSAAEAGQIKLFPGVAEMLARLKERGRLVSVVSSNEEETIRVILGEETAGHVDSFHCGASLFGKAAKLKTMLRHHGCSAAETVYVGDELRDAAACRKAGIAFGAVGWGYATPEALKKEQPKYFFDSVEEISRTLAG